MATSARDEDIKAALLREGSRKDYDCLSCRVMGASAFIGLGGYTYWSGHRQLQERQGAIYKSGTKLGMPARRLGITGTAVALVGLGLYRFFA